MCPVEITGDYFTAIIGDIEYRFHIRCRPKFFYTNVPIATTR